jgi:hypothetical protein
VSNLDHVLASKALRIERPVQVRGWQGLQGEERRRFLLESSDHCSLGLTID